MTFSLELSSDLVDVQKWVHEFAADVIRPAAAVMNQPDIVFQPPSEQGILQDIRRI